MRQTAAFRNSHKYFHFPLSTCQKPSSQPHRTPTSAIVFGYVKKVATDVCGDVKSSSGLTFCLELVSVHGHSRASLKDVGDKRKLFLFPLGKQTWDQFPFANFPSRRKVPHRFLDFSFILHLFSSQLSLPLFFFYPLRELSSPVSSDWSPVL